MISRFLFAIILLCIESFSFAHGYCIEDWACFSIENSHDGIDVYLQNNKAYVITSTIAINAKNVHDTLQQHANFEATEVLQGYQKKRVFTLKISNPNRPYRVKKSQFNWTPGDRFAKHDDRVRYRLPFAQGQRYRMIQGNGGNWSHSGASQYAVDFAMPTGTPVHAARGGIVIDLTERHNRGGANRRFARYANYVTILHQDQTTGEYYHLRNDGVVAEVGDRVETGDLIGYSGNTGFSSMPHLHFAVYKAKKQGNFQSLPFKFE